MVMKQKNPSFVFGSYSPFVLCLWMTLINVTGTIAQESSTTANRILPAETFLVEQRPAFIFWPTESKRTVPQPWVFYAPTLPNYPDKHELWMHEQFLAAGVAVAGIDVGEAYGSPQSKRVMDAFYEIMIRRFSKKPCLLGRSRGGLWVTSWACDYPDRFAGLAGIYPVFDFRTYPKVEKTAAAYGLSIQELETKMDMLNPIARVSLIAKAKLPAFLIHGDVDAVVPIEENSRAFVEAYKRAGVADFVRLIEVPGQGHNFWEGFFRCQPLVEFVIEKAKSNH